MLAAATPALRADMAPYTLIPERDRMVVDAAAKWLRPIQWQWFVTLTFPWNVKGETADVKLKEWLNLIERALKTR